LLGEFPLDTNANQPTIHPALDSRWTFWARQGLQPDVKDALLHKYQQGQPTGFLPLTLNLDVSAGLEKEIIGRDSMMESSQKAVGLALTAIGLTLTELLSVEGKLRVSPALSADDSFGLRLCSQWISSVPSFSFYIYI